MSDPSAARGVRVLSSLCLIAALVLAAAAPPRARAQEAPRSLSVGVQAGFPSTLTLRLRTPARTWDLDLAWNLERFLLAQGHVILRADPLPIWPRAGYRLGPGLTVLARDGTLAPGVSAHLGLEVPYGRAGLFIRALPRVELAPVTRFRLGGGVGLRVAL